VQFKYINNVPTIIYTLYYIKSFKNICCVINDCYGNQRIKKNNNL